MRVLLAVLLGAAAVGGALATGAEASHPPASGHQKPSIVTVSSEGQWDSTYSNTFNGQPQSQAIHFTWSESGTFKPDGTEIGAPQLQLSGTENDVNLFQSADGGTCTGTLSAKPPAQWLTTLVAGNANSSNVTASAAIPGTFDTPAEFINSSGPGNCAAFDVESFQGELTALGGSAFAGGVNFPTSQTRVSKSFPKNYSGMFQSASSTLDVADTVTVTVGTTSCSVKPSVEARIAAAASSSGSSCGTYVALGDSFSSGQTGGKPPCLRSSSSYPEDYDRQAIFVACSGAPASGIENGWTPPGEPHQPSQLKALGKRTKVVSLTAGGDDADLFHALYACVIKGILPTGCRDDLNALLHSKAHSLATVQSHLVSLFKAIRKKAPKAKVYALGYPIPVPDLVPRLCIAPLRLWAAGGLLGLRQRDAELFPPVLRELNRRVKAAAQKTHVHYIPPFSGHTICSQSPWFYPLARNPTTLHPNPAGQADMARLLRRAAGPPPP